MVIVGHTIHKDKQPRKQLFLELCTYLLTSFMNLVGKLAMKCKGSTGAASGKWCGDQKNKLACCQGEYIKMGPAKCRSFSGF